MINFRSIKFLFAILLSSILLSGCKDTGHKMKPNVSGKAGEVIVVIDKDIWETEVGNEIREILAKDYPYLPQKESSFKLINVRNNSFNSLLKAHRNIMLVNIGEDYPEPELTVQGDAWASPQTVIVLKSPNKEQAVALLKEKGEMLFNSLEQGERNRIIRNAKKYEEKNLRELVTAEFGGSPYFPKGYSLKKQVDNFIWISYETTHTNQGIFIYRIPYKDSTSLSLTNIINNRNEVLKLNVPAMLDDSYMTTSTAVEPDLTWIKYKGKQFAEIRGLWDVRNDFMGGPFVSHIFFDEKNNDLIVLEGFVYAPSKDKRNLLRQVESFLYSFEWDKK